ncbi:hypothetical protein [Flagellimonas sp. S3867]|uniref:hypothetical protein n=1 Tax=Flagellimonas sp. S3867 TaxID=2768063 RepID=UPI001686A442|nr:hypothetical protein [Flagellimonas sp. S3867]
MKNRTKRSHKLMAIFLTMIFMPSLLPVNYVLASNTGPNAPEAAGFEPVDATDMVNLGTGDLAYTLPLMDVDGFPVTLAYHAGITSTLDASWAGLGWYLNAGAINRQQIAVPDDWYAGTAINFISYENAETTYNIGVGFTGQAAEIGVGISWGGSKGLQGSVEASVGLKGMFGVGEDETGLGLSGSLNTDGGYYIGAYARAAVNGSSSDRVSANIGYSSGGDISASIGASNGFSSTGIGYSTSGTYSINAGAGGGTGGASLSTGSFSSGDYDVSVSSQGFKVSALAVGIPLYVKFGKTKIKYSLRKGYKDIAFGSMYSSEVPDYSSPSFNAPDGNFNDYQNRYVYMDVYEQPLPQEEAEFITDFRPNEEKLNFTYAGYDNFEVQANGINGRLRPRLFDNVTLFNRGFNAASTDTADRKNHVFYHNSGKNATRELGYNTNTQMQMYFEGAFSDKEIIAPSNYDFIGSSLYNLVDDPLPESDSFSGNPNNRATTPSYVEVFTNEELYQYDVQGLFANGTLEEVIEPESLPFNQRNNADLVDPKGIGAYKIASPDGKTYHFTLPVYHFETAKRTLLRTANQDPYSPRDVSESRQYNKYATHWLLTAVTGPDFVDVNNDGKVDEGDYGYWVRLDYGKWSDGYTWKQPYEDDARLYTTNQLSEIDDEDFGYFSFGRKQLYYLNKIVSREHTALFVKDIRHDAVGKTMNYKFTNQNAGYNANIGVTGSPGPLNQSDSNLHVQEGNPNDSSDDGVQYEREYTLRLDRIALVKNNIASSIQNNSGNGLGNQLNSYTKDQVVDGTWNSPDFQNAYSSNYQYLLHQEDNVLDIKDFEASGIQSNVLREVRFQHSYDLAKNSSNSIVSVKNPSKGKLTLDRLHFLGKGEADYMPPYAFEYYDEEKENISLEKIREDVIGNGSENDTYYRQNYIKERKKFVDNWGYIQNDEDRWSLKSIRLPQGATINLTYEEDKYWTEAFSRRYWEDNLEFAVKRDGNSVPGSFMYVYVRNEEGIQSNAQVSFDDYFIVGEKSFLDLWIIRTYDEGIFSEDFLGGIDLPGEYDYDVVVDEITSDNILVLKVYRDPLNPLDFCPPSSSSTRCDTQAVIDKSNFFDPALLAYFDNEGKGSNQHVPLPRGQYENSVGDGADHHTMSYKLLANKVPDDEIGGGLRVSKIETISSDGNIGVLEYNYNFPDDHERAGRPSGITSFAPVDGFQFVPYQSELPSPGVQYEYVTLYRKNANGTILDYTRYNFHVLKPAFNIFDENIELEDSDNTSNPYEEPIFKTEVMTDANGSMQGKHIGVHVNTAIIGQFKNIEQYNTHDQLISQVNYDYINGTKLDSIGKGRVQESFNSLKSIFETDNDGNNPVLKNRLLSVSTRTDYSNLLKRVTNNANGQTTWVEYGDVDPVLGSFRESRTLRPDRSVKRDYRIPAYSVYPDMGPKALDPIDNKNMLTQEAMTLSDVDLDANLTDDNHQWMTTSASVTTWRNSSVYDNESALTNDGFWRKHESYLWKEALDANGTFGREVTQADFSWSGAQSNSEWQKIVETTRYDHWSSPLEVKDVNDNYISTKMGNENTKVYASANAAYNEMFYSGAEDLVGSNFGGHVGKGSATQNSTNVHTGGYSMQLNSGQNAFVVSVTEGKTDRYKVSLWVKFGGEDAAKLRVAGNTIEPNVAETVRAGDWMQLNYYFTLSGTQTAEVFSNGGNIYVDDFRLHPVTSAMNTFVYNQWDELTHILGPNNLATQYEYDEAGRLANTYSEVIDFNGDGTGGFKQIESYNYNYQNVGN